MRHAGKLHMPDDIQIGRDPARQIAFDNLNVIAVKHQLQVRRAHGLDDPSCLVTVIKEISGRIIAVQRFDQDRPASRLRCFCRITQIANETCLGFLSRGKAGHHMHSPGTQSISTGQRPVNGSARLFLAANQRRKPVFASRYIPAHCVQPQHGQPGCQQCRLYSVDILIIGPMAFHRVKSGSLGRMDRIGKRTVIPQKSQIR